MTFRGRLPYELVPESMYRPKFEISSEDVKYRASLLVVDDKLAVFHVVPKRWHATHPHALLLTPGSHAIYVSNPGAVANLIQQGDR